MDYCICEKKNPLAVHGIFHSEERARQFLKDTIPDYVAKGYYMDKTLTPDDFTVRTYGKPASNPATV